MDSLFLTLSEQRLIIVMGKGGVGKSTVAAALGLLHAGRGKNVLLVSLREDDSLAEIFDLSGLSSTARSVKPHLWLLNVIVEDALREYLLEKIRFERLYHLIFENPVMRFFLEAAPGLEELLCIGKTHAMTKEVDASGMHTYDHIIVDAPATGHGVGLLSVAQTAAEVARVGPIAHRAREIDAYLRDSTKTALLFVTLLEELPVSETLELLKSVRALGMKVAGVFSNKVFPASEIKSEEYEALRSRIKRENRGGGEALFRVSDLVRGVGERQKRELKRLRKEGGMEVINIPFFFDSLDQSAAPGEMARCLEEMFL